MSSITKDDFFLAVADVLNTQAYLYKTYDELFLKVSVIVTKFKSLLIANGWQLTKLECELDILREHVTTFLPCVTPIRAWPQIFAMNHALGVQSILHVIELGIALPIGNAESERVFSFLWPVFSKERQSLSNDTMLDILRLRCDTNYNPQRYERAIELFLSEHLLAKYANTIDAWMAIDQQSDRENRNLFRPSHFDRHVTKQCNRRRCRLQMRRKKVRNSRGAKSLSRKFQMTSLCGLNRVTMKFIEH